MSIYRDDRNHQAEDDLRHLEDESPSGRNEGRRARSPGPDLPSPLYRLRALHSNETSHAWMEARKVDARPGQGRKTPSGNAGESFRDAHDRDEGVRPGETLPGPRAIHQPGGSEPADSPDRVSGMTEPVEGPSAADGPEPSGTTGSVDGPSGRSVDGPSDGPGAAAAGELPPDEDDQAAQGDDPDRSNRPLRPGTIVVAPTKYGKDLCEVQGTIRDLSAVNADEIVRIERIATQEDLRRHEANLVRGAEAFELCRQKIALRKLAMKLVSAHYMLEEQKILFYFSAESRVDFRELVKDLVSVFKMRIELRQIGVRDEARVTGGCGVCGRVLCCHGISDKLTPVSIKMAKDQNLSLNSLKISGPCGRLLCCLAYEYNFYRDARRELPNEGARFLYQGVLFRVVEVNALVSSVRMSGEDGRVLDMPAERFMYSEGKWQVRDES